MNKFLCNVCCAFILKKKNRKHFRNKYGKGANQSNNNVKVSINEITALITEIKNKIGRIDVYANCNCDIKTLFKFKNVLKKTLPDLTPHDIQCFISSEKITFIVNDLYVFQCRTIDECSPINLPITAISHQDYWQKQINFVKKVKPILKLEMPEINIIDDEFIYYKKIDCSFSLSDYYYYRLSLNQKLVGSLAKLINDLHNIKYNENEIEKYNLNEVKIINRPNYIDNFLKERYNLILKCLDKDERDEFIIGYEQFIKEHNNNLVFIHTDLFLKNLVVDNNCNINGILDISDSGLSNYNNQFAIYYYLFCKFDDKQVTIYKKLFDEYEKLSGRKINIIYLEFIVKTFPNALKKFNEFIPKLFNNNSSWEQYQSYSLLNFDKGKDTDERLKQYDLCNYLKKDDEILDIGCNTGFIDLTISNKVKNILGIEFEQNLVDIGNKVKDFVEIKNVEFRQADFNKFEIDKKFDFIFSFAVHHWIGMDLDAYGEKIYNLLKEKGKVIFETRNIEDLRSDFDYEDKIQKFIKNRFKIIKGDFLTVTGKYYSREVNFNFNRYFWILEKI
ncbi:MAG: methyltransferase domain-containing protein [Rickettsiales bacterium]|jgi:SAM-dependent methyltransferase|nr:methyltransferase domain-containing protein [Rickettsiales bacterium]